MRPPRDFPRARALAPLCACAIIFSSVAARAQDQARQNNQNSAAAQNATSAQPKLALEIAFVEGQRPAYWQVGGGGWSCRFKRVAGWQRPPGSLPVQAVEVDSRAEGDAVRVNVSVQVGEKHLDRQLDVATYLAREGESISVDGLGRFGVAPVSIRVVNVRAVKAEVPEATSKAASVAVVGVSRVKGTFPKFEVALRNDAGRDVAAMFVAIYTPEHKRLTQLAALERDAPVIPAGDVYELKAYGGDEGRAEGDTYTPAGLGRVVVEAAVFADGGYEGDAQQAAKVRALWLGRRQQIARILPLLREAASSPDAGTRAGIASLRARVLALDESVDQSAFDSLLSQFPAFDAAARRALHCDAEFEMHYRKNELLVMLEKIGGMNAGEQLPGVRDWLLRTADIYDRWLARLPAS
ncbi:MAG: hypothetical protein M3268_08920 [Acidobacteriota bacterium]|nr:hypothetical protein [Acidobacteriota bacterium]